MIEDLVRQYLFKETTKLILPVAILKHAMACTYLFANSMRRNQKKGPWKVFEKRSMQSRNNDWAHILRRVREIGIKNCMYFIKNQDK